VRALLGTVPEVSLYGSKVKPMSSAKGCGIDLEALMNLHYHEYRLRPTGY
jgi:hypothetical protein